MKDRTSQQNDAAMTAFWNWCREYLELQHSPAVGREFGILGRCLQNLYGYRLGGRPSSVDQLLEDENAVWDSLTRLSLAHAESCDRPSLPVRQQAEGAERQRTLVEANGTRGSALDDLSTRTLLFVYGTLKQGFSRHAAVADQVFLGTAKTAPAYRLFDCGCYPALVADKSGGAVSGELYAVDLACLAQLDEIEGVPQGLYLRSDVRLQSPACVATTYVYAQSTEGLTDLGACWP